MILSLTSEENGRRVNMFKDNLSLFVAVLF